MDYVILTDADMLISTITLAYLEAEEVFQAPLFITQYPGSLV